MAVTPRTILSSPASATIAIVSFLAFSMVGLLALEFATEDNLDNTHLAVADETVDDRKLCDGVQQMLGEHERSWSEFDWLVYANCFERHKDIEQTIRAAERGLSFYPESEALYNLKGYYQIVRGDYKEAIGTLKTGLKHVDHPSDGTMSNNLAWASLWAPRAMKLTKARELYQSALELEPGVCETMHTGLWVEYAIARKKSGLDKYRALKNFFELRRDYEPCQSRAATGDWNKLMEVIGAGLIFADVDQGMDIPDSIDKKSSDGRSELHNAMLHFVRRYGHMSADTICRHAAPVAGTHHTCVNYVEDVLKKIRTPDGNSPVKKKALRNNQKGGSGGSGCAYATH